MILVDTGPLVAAVNRRDARHQECRDLLDQRAGEAALVGMSRATIYLSGSSLSAASSTSPTTPVARCPTWSSTRRWRAWASCSSWASC